MISGAVTDADAGTPLAGVKVTLNSTASTQSAVNGSFSVNSAPSTLNLRDSSPRFHWEGPVGAFLWNAGSASSAGGDIRNALGARILSLPAAAPLVGRSAGGAAGGSANGLAKAAAMNTLSFEKTGYTTVSQQINGSKDGLAVALKKAAAARKANLTWFESYPDPGSEECIKYNGCQWAGQFAAVNGKQPESWVKANNICAVHEKDFAKYKLKTLRLVQGNKTIDVKVYDECADSDCDGCCTQNAAGAGFLIDVEKYTAERFGTREGVVEWTCIDCTN
jgi:hypothetical protein